MTVSHTLWFVVYQKRILTFWFVCVAAFPSGIHFSVWQQYIYWRNCLNRTCKCLGMCCQFRKLSVNILFCRYHLTQSERPRILSNVEKRNHGWYIVSIWTIFGLNVIWSEHGIIVQNIETSNVVYGLICSKIIHVFEIVISILFYVWRGISVKNSHYCISNVLNQFGILE